MKISEEIDRQICILSDPKVKWVQHEPYASSNQACAVIYYPKKNPLKVFILSKETMEWLSRFVELYVYGSKQVYEYSISRWNDYSAGSRQEVIWMLEEAYDQALWEGL